MKNNQAPIAALVVGLLAGSGVTYAATRGGSPETQTSTTMTHDMSSMASASPSSPEMTMSQMMSSLKGKSGDAFDEAFISEMIMHHQGAIDMAEMAKSQAGHQEIKDMAEGIVSAQQSEIATMKQWQKDWGY